MVATCGDSSSGTYGKHTHWDQTIGDDATAKLTITARAPALHRTTCEHSTTVVAARRHLRCSRNSGDVDWDQSGNTAAVAQLTASCRTPALHHAASEHGTAMTIASGHSGRRGDAHNVNRNQAGSAEAITELTAGAQTPALHPAAIEYRTAMRTPGSYCVRGRDAEDIDGDITAAANASCTKLPFVTKPPALHATAREQCATMPSPCRNGGCSADANDISRNQTIGADTVADLTVAACAPAL